jgi:hypothetical protein
VKDGEGNSLLHPQAILFLLANVLIWRGFYLQNYTWVNQYDLNKYIN